MISALVLGKYPSAPRGEPAALRGLGGGRTNPEHAAVKRLFVLLMMGVMFQSITGYWGVLLSFNGPRVLYVLR